MKDLEIRVTPPLERFSVDPDDCLLLADLIKVRNLSELARLRQRDLSVISRRLTNLAKSTPYVRKQGLKWEVTREGRALTDWVRDAMQRQSEALLVRPTLTVAATIEFTSRVLAPNLRAVFGADVFVRVLARDESIEPEILAGKADLGFDCGRPQSPLIRFRAVAPEPFCIVAAPQFGLQRAGRSVEGWQSRPFIACSRIPVYSLLGLTKNLDCVALEFTTLSGAREACVAGLGWTVLPRYCVSNELQQGTLVELPPDRALPEERFGVWWLRDNRSVTRWVADATRWLGSEGRPNL